MSHSVELEEVRLDSETDCDTDREVPDSKIADQGDEGGSADEKPPPTKKKGRDPSQYNLVEAAQYGYLERCRQLVEKEGANVNEKDEENIMPLHWAAINNRIPVVSYFLQKGADINAIGGELKSPSIHWATRCCDGGITSNIPLVSDPDVITVTPFAGFCDICPQKESCTQHMINICDQPMQLSPSNLYRLAKSLCPTSWKELEDLYHQGYNDCLSFFRKEGLIPDPKIDKRKDSSLPSPSGSDDSGIILSTMACDLPGNRRSGHSRITSMTLSASGEFLSCFGGSEKGSFNSITLEEMERGLDLKGTEKATHLMRQYGKEEAHLALSRHRFSDVNAAIVQAGSSGVVSRIMDPPVQIVRISFLRGCLGCWKCVLSVKSSLTNWHSTGHSQN